VDVLRRDTAVLGESEAEDELPVVALLSDHLMFHKRRVYWRAKQIK
jgi:hypothetical protein